MKKVLLVFVLALVAVLIVQAAVGADGGYYCHYVSTTSHIFGNWVVIKNTYKCEIKEESLFYYSVVTSTIPFSYYE